MNIRLDREKLRKYEEEVNRFEIGLEERHREEQRHELRAYIEGLDRQASQEVLEWGGYANKGLVWRTILSGVGKIRVKVHRYRNKNGHSIYPLRDLYGIGRETPHAQRRCMRLAIERSYAWSATLLQEQWGMQISRMRLWKIIQEEGRKERARQEAERRKIFKAATTSEPSHQPRPAVIEADGTLIASRERGMLDDFGRHRMEVKLGVMFRGTRQLSARRRATCERSVYAQVEDADGFAEHWYAHCRSAGLRSDDPVHVLSDGAQWIGTMRQAVFPGSRYTLDLYHLKEKAGTVLVDHQYKRFMSFVMAGLPRTALEYLRQLHPSDEQHAHELRAFCQYVEGNLDGIRYQPHEIHGSGVIEKMADLVVKKRMKRQGMRWSCQGANNLLALRTRYLNAQTQHLRASPSPH